MHDDELTAAIREVRERARNRAQQASDGVAAPDLMPLVHARDAAEAKVAAIGTVNPRPPGLKNSLIQSIKRLTARALDWHVREQVEFNRGVMACIQSSLEALVEVNRGLAVLAAQHKSWAEWRTGFEERRSASEIHLLRSISELQAAFQHRVTLLEQNYRELIRQQHGEFTAALDRNSAEVQQRLWKDLERIRGEYEKIIYTELRTLRQRQAIAASSPEASPTATALPVADIPVDWMRFADIFRGSEERIREHQKHYTAKFAGAQLDVLDIGCGRGEFLDVSREAGLPARGIDLSEECVALCRSKGLPAERAEIFAYLGSLPDRSLGGAFCSQVVEHLPPERLPVLVHLLSAKLHPGALVAIETPNPECLAIFATHFYIDPTHTRPVPASLLRFYLEEAGFGNIEIERLAPAIESMPSLAELPSSVREAFFGSLDYAILARKL